MTDEIVSAVLKVRDTGETNLFDINAVMRIADRMGLYELVVYLAEKDNWAEYGNFIMTGEREKKERA